MSEPIIIKGWRVGIVWAWYDFWVGWYWNATKKRLYILPIPTLGIYIDMR